MYPGGRAVVAQRLSKAGHSFVWSVGGTADGKTYAGFERIQGMHVWDSPAKG